MLWRRFRGAAARRAASASAFALKIELGGLDPGDRDQRNVAADEFLDRGDDPECAGIIARLQAELFDWALHPNDHITTPREKIANYADSQLQVKGGILIGVWDEAELASIKDGIAQRAKM